MCVSTTFDPKLLSKLQLTTKLRPRDLFKVRRIFESVYNYSQKTSQLEFKILLIVHCGIDLASLL